MSISTEGLRPNDVQMVQRLVDRLRLLAGLEKPHAKRTASTADVYRDDYNRLNTLSRSRALTDAESRLLAHTMKKLERLGKAPA